LTLEILRYRPFALTALLALGWTAAVVAAPATDGTAFPYALQRDREVAVLAGGAGFVGLAMVLASSQEALGDAELAALDPADLNDFDRPATARWSDDADRAADMLLAATAAAPLLLMVSGPGHEEPGVVGAMYGEALLVSVGAVQLLKGVAGRVRPYAYNDDPDIPAEMLQEKASVRSFPSGHTATAFTAAVFLGTVYGELHPEGPGRGWVWAGGLAAATAVGWLRIESGRHFPTDVLAGAVVGAAAGWLVPRWHREQGGVPTALAAPAGGIGVAWGGRF
jgi:membrane-associated phospholipid phosphatase